ncbi:MAG TPA: hypothetical protein DEQ20_06565 [Desulfobulbaceae bacterium]|nr:hypothetical protein [Desulfobulbaceae bacterium]
MSRLKQNNRPAEGKVLRLYLKKLDWLGASDCPGELRAAPEIHLDFGHGNSLIAGYDDCHDIWLRLRVTATMAGRPMFSAEIVQAGIFRLVPARAGRLKELMAWCSGVLYAQALQVLATAMRNGGFEPLQFHERSFSPAFMIDVGGPAITLGRLSELGHLPGKSVLRRQAPASIPRRKRTQVWAAVSVMLAVSASLYLFVGPDAGLDRLQRLLSGRVAKSEPERSLPEAGGQALEGLTPWPSAPARDAGPAQYAVALEDGAQWLGDQPAGYFTLQIAALDRLENLPQITGDFRFDEPLRLVRSVAAAGAPPKYLVFLGSYSSEADAAAAARKLPAGEVSMVLRNFADIARKVEG